MKSGRKKFLIGIGVIAALVVLLFVEEHFRGKWQLTNWKARMAAQGEKFGIDECLPPVPPPGDNGFNDLVAACARLSTPLIYQSAPPNFRFTAPGKAIVTRSLPYWKRNSSRDSTNIDWRVLEADLAAYAEPLADARTALRKPVLDGSLPYGLGFNLLLPHLARFKGLAQILSAAAAQDLHLGRLDGVLENIEAMLALTRAMQEERLIISQLVRQAIASLAVGTTWQALQAPGWNETQLARLQQAWQSVEFSAPMAHALEMERAIGGMSFDALRESNENATEMLGLWQNQLSGASASGTNAIRSVDDLVQYLDEHHEELLARNVYLPIWRFAWSHQDELNYLELTQMLIDGARASAMERSGLPAATVEKQIQERLSRANRVTRVRCMVSSEIFPSLERTVSRCLMSEALKELTVAAVALKRYETGHGHPPAGLSVLVPDFLPELPRDYFVGQPLHYRLTDAGGFLLYSVGKDGRDDNGDPKPMEGLSKNFSLQNGRDLVWPRPATADEIAAIDTVEPKPKAAPRP